MAEKTIAVPNFEEPASGYIVIAPLSPENRAVIHGLQDQLAERFGSQNLWLPRDEQLHVTVAHVVSPDGTYDQDKDVLYNEVRHDAVRALQTLALQPLKIDLTFDQIKAFPPAIIIQGHDDGSMDALRQQFVEQFEPPQGTRRPPSIIHSTIARFRNELDFEEVQAATQGMRFSFTQQTTKLQLIHETKLFTQAYDVLQEFPGDVQPNGRR